MILSKVHSIEEVATNQFEIEATRPRKLMTLIGQLHRIYRMKVFRFNLAQLVWIVLLCGPGMVQAQGIIRSGTSTPISPPGLANHHIDAWSIAAPMQIRTLDATVRINPMNQVQPGGSLSVFPTLLSASERALDSHFLFDVSTANILEANEDTTMIRTRVEFTSNFQSSFDLAKIVARDGHTPYEVFVFGTYLNGAPFSDSVVFVPEPSTAALLLLGFFTLTIRRKRAL